MKRTSGSRHLLAIAIIAGCAAVGALILGTNWSKRIAYVNVRSTEEFEHLRDHHGLIIFEDILEIRFARLPGGPPIKYAKFIRCGEIDVESFTMLRDMRQVAFSEMPAPSRQVAESFAKMPALEKIEIELVTESFADFLDVALSSPFMHSLSIVGTGDTPPQFLEVLGARHPWIPIAYRKQLP